MTFLRRIWAADDEFDFAGRYFQAWAVLSEPRPLQRGGPVPVALRGRPGQFPEPVSLEVLLLVTPAPGRRAKVAAIPLRNEAQAREIRHRRRDFIRAHHPDRGGDTDLFVSGLRALDAGLGPGYGALPAVTVIKRHPWPVRKVIAAARRLRYGPKPARVR